MVTSRSIEPQFKAISGSAYPVRVCACVLESEKKERVHECMSVHAHTFDERVKDLSVFLHILHCLIFTLPEDVIVYLSHIFPSLFAQKTLRDC